MLCTVWELVSYLSVADCEGLFAGQNATTGHLSKLQLHYTVAAKTYTYTYTIQYFTCNVESVNIFSSVKK